VLRELLKRAYRNTQPVSTHSPLDPRPSRCYLPTIGMAKKISRFEKIRQEVLALWDEGFHPDNEPTRLHRFLHFWILVGKSFVRNRCPLRASALSYTTLLALIPMLAVAMSVTTSLLKKEGKDQIENFIERNSRIKKINQRIIFRRKVL